MIKGLKDFLMRGNIVDLAVAFVVGLAFAGVITAFAEDFIGGIIGIIGIPDFKTAHITINDSDIIYGSTITALINFVIVASVIYFVVVVPMNAIKARGGSGEDEAGPDEISLLTEIRDSLKARS